MPPRTTDRFF